MTPCIVQLASLFVFGIITPASASLHFGTASSAPAAPRPEVDLGTTLVAIKYKEGVVLAADSRTSISGYVSHRYARKIVPVTENCLLCRSGSAADTQQLANAARLEFLNRRYRYCLRPSVSQVAHFIKSEVYDSSQGASLLVAGYDAEAHARIFTVSPSGALLEEDAFASAGSGSTYIIGHLDHHVGKKKNTLDLEERDAIELCKQAIELAIGRDGSSGGITRIFVCSAQGIREMTIYPSQKKTIVNGGEDLVGFAASSRSHGAGSE